MSNEDILSFKDWIKISIRFPGSCLKCKKRLLSGEYGYWSKSSKAILHEQCYDSMQVPSLSTKKIADLNEKKEDGDIHDDGGGFRNLESYSLEKSLIDFINKYDKKIKCFICKNKINLHDEIMISLLRLCNKNYYDLDVLYCSDCLVNFNSEVSERYKKNFLSQIS